MKSFRLSVLFLTVITFSGCENVKYYNYTNFKEHPPLSILVLPPLNESTNEKATYGYLSTCTMPLVEHGYYVFPVAAVDRYFKANGKETVAEMHSAPLLQIRDIFAADAVLYVTVQDYGPKYFVIASATIVTADARLVDVRTGTLLWQGTVSADQATTGEGGPVIAVFEALIHQVVSNLSDQAYRVSSIANRQFQGFNGLLPGPYLLGKD